MSITYTKRKNTSLFASLERHGYTKIQNYIPTCKNFFVLNQTNYNSINILGQWYLKKIHSVDEDGFFSGVVENSHNGKTKNVDIFIKNAPLLDPVKYMVGVYHSDLHKVSNLPQLDLSVTEGGQSLSSGSGGAATTEVAPNTETSVIDKVNNPSNASYIDNLFNIVNSQLLEKGFVHGIEWYGSFLAIKKDFEFNIYDDLDYLFHSKYFLKHVGSLFHVPKEILDEVQKPSLKIEEQETKEGEACIGFDDFEDITDMSVTIDTDVTLAPSVLSITHPSEKDDPEAAVEPSAAAATIPEEHLDLEIDLLEEHSDNFSANRTKTEQDEETLSNSSYSSRTSYTNEYLDFPSKEEGGIDTDEDDDEGCPDLVESYTGGVASSRGATAAAVVSDGSDDDNEEGDGAGDDEDEEEQSMGSDYEEEYIGATIPEFPVQLICVEACEDTLDALMLNDELNEHELFSCMMQLIMILATYQKLYQFTHNDLHTNNVMFVETNKKYLHYEYNGKKYLVPTYGKIYKIIDFGRSIFTIQNQLFCGDCYQKNGDAYTQYNFGPCWNEAKPTVEPNYSFDLCRLACSMFDHLIQNIGDIQKPAKLSPFKRLVVRLCTDDKGLNVLYKRNREERYPCFKLYKMISRTVHNHTPDLLLETPDFSRYCYDGTTLPAGVSKKDCYQMNIDSF
jgi:hypothetical protein